MRVNFFFTALGHLVWDPNRIFFEIPKLHHPIAWYGILFAVGFFVGYCIVKKMLSNYLEAQGYDPFIAKKGALLLTERLTLFAIVGTLLGARLGHVFFYGWPFYSQFPLEILKIWEGGLSSHGAAVGIVSALLIFSRSKVVKEYGLSFKVILDAVVVAAAFAGGCIRIGNFINQEILGTPTTLPWGVIFLHPIEGPAGIPLHPVQLYEALFYFFTFGILAFIWNKTKALGSGLLAGSFFVLVFTFRFLIEFLKLPQSEMFDETQSLNMGQWLSLPFIVIGIYFLIRCFQQKSFSKQKQ